VRGEAPLGIVYQTDAAADRGVKVVGVFPDNIHRPIIYPIAAIQHAAREDSEPVHVAECGLGYLGVGGGAQRRSRHDQRLWCTTMSIGKMPVNRGVIFFRLSEVSVR
jgi:hypothetical protein